MPSGSRQGRTSDPGLSPAERTKLVNILARLASPFDGERAAAGLLATRLLDAKRIRWDDLIGQAVQPYERPDTAPDSRSNLDLCRRHSDCLDRWQHNFVSCLSSRRTPLSSRQVAKLAEIASRLRARGLA